LLELIEDIEIAGEASNGKMAVELAAKLKPDVVLMDLIMPEMDGIQATQRICALGFGTKIIALTSFAEDEKIFPAIQAGATSFLLKDVSPMDLVEAIRAAYRGEARLHPNIARRLMDHATARPATTAAPEITSREMEVLELVARGMSNREIGEHLTISEKTVKTHISSLLSKLGLEARTQLAIYAIRNGLAEEN
jgi:NarL family two-component system response regulator LiaR